jgi:hypothetical protein
VDRNARAFKLPDTAGSTGLVKVKVAAAGRTDKASTSEAPRK